MLYTDPYGAPAAPATGTDNPCIPKCFKFGHDTSSTNTVGDECWGSTITNAYYTGTTLDAEIPGCKIADDSGFCMCDETTGWFAPLDGNGAVDSDFGGACVPLPCTYEY
jgi:hypothetical protein